MSKEIRIGASVLHVPGLGFVSVLHKTDESPLVVLERFRAGEEVPVVGPFATEGEAKTHGSAALTVLVQKMRERGLKAYRPEKS